MALPNAPASVANATLFSRLRDLRRDRPELRALDCAGILDVSEAELVAARAAAGEAVALTPDPRRLLEAVPSFGPVMALSRSRNAVLECDGVYGRPDIGEHTGIVIGDNIDLRIFPGGWKFAYAVIDEGRHGTLRSLQVFDAAGTATHKIYLRAQSDSAAFERLARELAVPADAPLQIEPKMPQAPTPDANVDLAAYRTAYAAMADTHDFFMLLRRFGLAREQGLRLADETFARPLERTAHRGLFARAAAEKIPLMLFVSNEGIVQISSGPIPAPQTSGPWCNLVDPRFNLHLREDGIARAWAVRKPTVNGLVTSLELYDPDGTLSLQIFGERHEGSGERADWAEAIGSLPAA